MSCILVIDDEQRIAAFVSRALRAHGLPSETVCSGEEAIAAIRGGRFSLVILDLMMPRVDGVDVLRAAHDLERPPRVIVLSAMGDVATKVRCLELGASDFIAKPFALPELLARVRALVARRRRAPAELVCVGMLTLDVPFRRADWAGQPLRLSAKEFALLLELATEPGAVRTKRDLLARIWEFPNNVRTRTVDTHASRLRRKLTAAGAPVEVVQNVWGEGYRLGITGG